MSPSRISGLLARQRKRRQERERLYIICATMPISSSSGSQLPPSQTGTQPSCESPAKRISRRRFARDAAAIAAVTLSPSSLLALPCHHGLPAPTQAGADANKLNLPPDQMQEVEARLANIVRKYGDRLSEEQRQHLRRILSYNETMLAPIRAFPLRNSDSPATVLKLSTGKESPHPDSRAADSSKAKREAQAKEGSAN
jgi:hypothetical protein